MFALLQADAVGDTLALQALEARLDHLKIRRVNANGHSSYVGLAGEQIQKLGHRRYRLQHALVHVDVEDLGAVLHLILGHLQRLLILVLLDQAEKLSRAGHVTPLTDVHKVCVVAYLKWFQASQYGVAFIGVRRRHSGLNVLDGVRDSSL